MLGGVRAFIGSLTPIQRGLASALLSLSIWKLVYYFLLFTPTEWPLQRAKVAGLVVGFVGGALCRSVSRQFWPLGLGAGLGILLGGAEFWVTDTLISTWERGARALSAMWPYPLQFWASISVGWAAAHVVVRWVASRAPEIGRGRPTKS
jgi:hypothetical protein